VIFPTFTRRFGSSSPSPPLFRHFGTRGIFRAGDTFRTKEFSVLHCDAHFSNVANCNLCGALYVHTDESDGYQKISCLSCYVRVNISRDSRQDFTARTSWLIVDSENSTRLSRTVLPVKRAGHSKSPFIPHRTINRGTERDSRSRLGTFGSCW